MKQTLHVVIVIPFYNEQLYLKPTLASLASQRNPSHLTWEVLFVDNGSLDNSRNIIKRICARYRIPFTIVNEPKRGTVYSRKTGLDTAAAINPDIIISTDADIVLPTTFVESTYNDCIHKHVEVLHGRREKSPKVDLWKRIVSKEIYNWRRSIWNLEYRLFGPYFFGAYFAIKPEVYKKIPLFQPAKHEKFLGEDILLSRRCHYIGASFGTSTLGITPDPRKDIAFQKKGLGSISGNTPIAHNKFHLTNELVFKPLSEKEERKTKDQMLSFVAKRLIWSTVDAYIFWKKTDMIHANALTSAKRGQKFLQIPSREFDKMDKKLNQNILYSQLVSRHLSKTKKNLERYLHDKTT